MSSVRSSDPLGFILVRGCQKNKTKQKNKKIPKPTKPKKQNPKKPSRLVLFQAVWDYKMTTWVHVVLKYVSTYNFGGLNIL